MTRYTLEPTGNRVAVAPIEDEMVTASGLVLPEISQRRPMKGKVVAVGPAVEVYRPGDIALFPRYAGTEVEVDRSVFIVLAEHELVGRLIPHETH